MSALRPECGKSNEQALDYAETIRLVLAAVSRRRSLAHGVLHDDTKHCAMGCFWKDYPNVPVYTRNLDKIAAINDLTPKATPKARWKRMVKWLRNEVASLCA